MRSADAEVFDALRRAFEHLSVRLVSLWRPSRHRAWRGALHRGHRRHHRSRIQIDARALVDVLDGRGLKLRMADDSFVEQTRVLPLLHVATSIPVDVVLAGPGIEELFFEGALPTDIEGVVVPVARAEDLVVMKMLAGRPQDLEDVAAILSARGDAFDPER